jgi:hypothetical protein
LAVQKNLGILATYVINQIQERGSRPIKTQLMKLLYLLDVEYYRRYSKTVSEVEWIYYHHGPYSPQLDGMLGVLPDVEESGFVSRAGRKGYTYSSEADVDRNEQEFIDVFGYSTKSVLDRVLDRWALEDLWVLLDYVYFETEPMQDAHRGEPLDFSKVIPAETRMLALPKTEFPKEKLVKLRQRLVESRGKRRPAGIRTPASYDAIYFEAIRVMSHDELASTNVPNSDAVDGPQE